MKADESSLDKMLNLAEKITEWKKLHTITRSNNSTSMAHADVANYEFTMIAYMGRSGDTQIIVSRKHRINHIRAWFAEKTVLRDKFMISEGCGDVISRECTSCKIKYIFDMIEMNYNK